MSKKRMLDLNEIKEIIHKAEICYMAINTENAPYIIPMNYGYADNILYLHTGLHGKKLDLLRLNNRVGFSMTNETELVVGEKGCNWTVKGKSVTGWGKAEIISNNDEKKQALDILMSHYTGGPFEYNQKSLDAALIIRIDIEEMTGKSIE